jgi:oligopeptide/dipeptide ABC transporter ATP-binding protein
MSKLLEIKNLRTHFETAQGVVKAVNDVSLTLERKKIHALVGESGCGKSMTALSILRLVPTPPGKIVGGEVLFYPQKNVPVDLLKLSENQMRAIRGNDIAMIFQEPMTSLNPVYTVGNQIMEAIILHQKKNKKQARAVAIEMLEKVEISQPQDRLDDYPHQMSGGMRQRVMIAMALSCKPDLLIADEPTTALDVTIQAQILELMHGLVDEMDMALLLITHDLGIVAEHARDVSVMYAGQIVEEAPVREIFAHPRHPYTRGLLQSIPSLKKKGDSRLHSIPGTVPNLATLGKGCSFKDRCEKKQDDCVLNNPQLMPVKGNKGPLVRCFYPY